MTRLLIQSDLHLDSSMFYPPDAETFDIAVVAGDVGNGPHAVEWARDSYSGRPVIFVPRSDDRAG